VLPQPAATSGELEHDQRAGEGVDSQLKAELESAGFEVVLVTDASAPSPDGLEQIARRTESMAAILIVHRNDELAADVWVTDRITGKTVLRRVRPDAPAPEAERILALRAVELLHASLVELNLPHDPRGEEPPPPEVEKWVAPPPGAAHPPLRDEPAASPKSRENAAQAQPRMFALALGAAALGGPGGLDLAVAPAIGVAWQALPAWTGEAWLIGPALSTLSGAGGSVDTDEELLVVRVRYDLTAERARISPFAAAGGGAYRLGARGEADPPNQGRSGQALSGLLVGGGGVRLRPWRSIAIVLALDAGWLPSRVAVRVAGQTVARTPLPLVVGTLAGELSW
jgi:hypothetical protein